MYFYFQLLNSSRTCHLPPQPISTGLKTTPPIIILLTLSVAVYNKLNNQNNFIVLN